MNKARFLETSRFRSAPTPTSSRWSRMAVLAACVWLLAAAMAGLTPARAADLLSPAQMDQLVAPVALYPDSLLSQVLMASTYPLEVVEAQRWRAAQPRKMSDQQISAGVQDKPWDPSVKSLTAFPDVLDMMSDKIDWTQQLGDAFLDQQKDVMDAVQRLRSRAQASGRLNSGSQQTVVVNSEGPPIIQIVPANPEVVYVPVYNPLIVFGPWPYPAYPPFYWYPPAYRPAPGVFISFGFGLYVGHALWGHVDWRQRAVTINVNRYNYFNHTHITHDRWVHNVNHRRGVEYRNSAVRQRYDQGSRSPAARDAQRQSFRNQASTGRAQLRQPDNRRAAQRAVQNERSRVAPAAQRGSIIHTPNAGVQNNRARSNRGEGGTGLRTNNAQGNSAPSAGGSRPGAVGNGRPNAPPRNETRQPSVNRTVEAPRPRAPRGEAPQRSETRGPSAGNRGAGERAPRAGDNHRSAPERKENRGDKK